MPALSGPSTTPDFVVGLVIVALTILGQARTRPWATDKNSPLPLIVLALGLLIYFGYKSTAGPLSAQQQEYLLVTLAFGIVFGALRARTMMLWKEATGRCVRGTPATLVLWVLTGLGMGLYYGFGNITYCGFVLYLGVTMFAQQVFVIVRGVRAARSLASPTSVTGAASGEDTGRSDDSARPSAADRGSVAPSS